ncbi:hypothetical protein [Chitinimonas arctica]|uniref:hypothetical protein n=1 Tax=Chitinimonas arctica TaxID=2594795 RepID=UPI0015D0F3F4|nr:hypothetical protein [Chitinimonas arctica]
MNFLIFELIIPVLKNQKSAFPEILVSGAAAVGNGKSGFPGGTQIPPAAFNIVWPWEE